jgi:UDP-N-acetylglucosamine--N-acetylmuramyl-(pentapeptide) pyrophosphoryl-undecaprenol N-acetylglucosamine transferase
MFPALAVVRALRARGARVTLLTDMRGARFARGEEDCHTIAAASPSGGLLERARGISSLLLGTLQSLLVFGRLRPVVAATFGGYASVPAAMAALLRRTPFLIHEQNAVLGRANRLIARRAEVVALSFAHTAAVPALKDRQPLVVGNPVRPDFAAEGAATSGLEADPAFRLLVIGGSQGARIFSDVVPAAVALLAQERRSVLHLAQQCRPEDLERVSEAYRAMGQTVETAAFFEDVPARMKVADLVIARSGASTVAEILALARPALLVPYPYAADDHQTANARALTEAGAAVLVPQAELTADRLAAELDRLMRDAARRLAMAESAAGLARPDAAARLADAILGLAARGARP